MRGLLYRGPQRQAICEIQFIQEQKLSGEIGSEKEGVLVTSQQNENESILANQMLCVFPHEFKSKTFLLL